MGKHVGFGFLLVPSKVVHDLDFPANILDVVAVNKLATGDGFASELLVGLFVRD